MRPSISGSLLAGFLAVVSLAPMADGKRQWQTGTLVDAGIKHRNFAGGAASRTVPPANSVPAAPQPNPTPEVGTYVIETDQLRFELEALTSVGASQVETEFRVGQKVTFAIDKKTAYILLPDGHEQRFRVVKKATKK